MNKADLLRLLEGVSDETDIVLWDDNGIKEHRFLLLPCAGKTPAGTISFYAGLQVDNWLASRGSYVNNIRRDSDHE